jgi:dCTP diphosphatase
MGVIIKAARRMRTAMLSDASSTIADAAKLVRDFSRERDWEQFHHPKDLGLALAIETGEVLEHFRFSTNDEIKAKFADPTALREFSHELADVFWALLRLAEVTGVDLAAALEEKVALAAEKYPVEASKGKAFKYTEYE